MTDPNTVTMFEDNESSAAISDDGVYRYSLTRRWDGYGPNAVFIMPKTDVI